MGEREPLLHPRGLVYPALREVLAGIGAIPKGRETSDGARYKYRGIDDVLSALQPLLAEHRLVMTPRYHGLEVREVVIGRNKTPGWQVTLQLSLTFRHAGDGSVSDPIETYGTGWDTNDKAVYKAMSGALKYALYQAFSIPTEEAKDPEAGEQVGREAPQQAQQRGGRGGGKSQGNRSASSRGAQARKQSAPAPQRTAKGSSPPPAAQLTVQEVEAKLRACTTETALRALKPVVETFQRLPKHYEHLVEVGNQCLAELKARTHQRES